MEEPDRSRRSALKTMACLLAGGAGLWRFLTPRRLPSGFGSRATIEIASTDVPADGALVLPQSGIAVVRAGSGLRALDLACTHLGCTVSANANGFACPCHGSRFTCSGERIEGPASRALREMDVAEAGGIVRVTDARGVAAGRSDEERG